ncbi:helix-turn-helix domain-containing protein [Streptomyces sp. MBT62]|uniref:helix-turn-helix domain-containing protein n=1 Tax=Streptomyces sp. MBT62 TaxID=2800410 RepID=UPI0019099709|nr:helix-turn-helix transcriptional regulator [Streptomyces sp. MBT62]MBK3562422.1 helix-turn-helix domain-containing protein [Streptomyces sp. MBT62]
MNAETQLGDFLKARRSHLRPADVGVSTYGERRRVPGLRREELALLAGVSVSYYTRLEQGQSPSASPEVLDALAGALRLDEPERRYLHDLARTGRQRPRGRRLPAERVTEENAQLLDVLGDTPAIVQGRCADVLAWNRLGHTLFAGHLDPEAPDRPAERPNLARLVFLDPHTRDLYADWPTKARAVVGNLRLMAGRFPDDAALHALVGELSSKSGEFASMWADHRVKSHMFAAYDMKHPLVGPLTVVQQSLGLGRGISLVVATTPADSPSRAALTLLAQAAVPAGSASNRSRVRTD